LIFSRKKDREKPRKERTLPFKEAISSNRNHNLFKHPFLINLMVEENQKPEENEETLKKKAKELEEKE